MAVATPSAPMQPDASQTWWTAALAGAVGSLSVLAVLLTLGMLAFAPLGADAARVGVTASFVTAVVGGLVSGLAVRWRWRWPACCSCCWRRWVWHS